MATTLNRSSHLVSAWTLPQKVCITLGVFFVLAGLGGIAMPGMLGMHLSMTHNLIHLISGVLALWVGYADDSRKAYIFCMAFGCVYGLLGLSGFAFGRPGFPGVGHMEADQNLLRIIPNVLELGTADHIVHVLLGVAFVGFALVWKRRSDVTGRAIVNEQGRTYSSRRGFGRHHSEPDLKDTSLGKSDINRPVDEGRRNEFERRI